MAPGAYRFRGFCLGINRAAAASGRPVLLRQAEALQPVDDAQQPARAADCERLPGQQVKASPGQERGTPRISPYFGPDRWMITAPARVETASVDNHQCIGRDCEASRLRKLESSQLAWRNSK